MYDMIMDDMGIGYCLTVYVCGLADNCALSTDPSLLLSYCFHQCLFFLVKFSQSGTHEGIPY